MPLSPEQAGQRIGKLIVEARKQGAATAQNAADVQIKQIQQDAIKPVLNVNPEIQIDMSEVAKAIEGIQFGTSGVNEILTALVASIGELTPAELSGVEKAILDSSSNETITKLTESLEFMIGSQTRELSSAQQKSFKDLSESLNALAKAVNENTTSASKAMAKLADRMERPELMQVEAIESMYAPRKLVLDANGDPTGVQIMRSSTN